MSLRYTTVSGVSISAFCTDPVTKSSVSCTPYDPTSSESLKDFCKKNNPHIDCIKPSTETKNEFCRMYAHNPYCIRYRNSTDQTKNEFCKIYKPSPDCILYDESKGQTKEAFCEENEFSPDCEKESPPPSEPPVYQKTPSLKICDLLFPKEAHHFENLGLLCYATTTKEAKSAFKDLMRKHHPDHCTTACTEFYTDPKDNWENDLANCNTQCTRVSQLLNNAKEFFDNNKDFDDLSDLVSNQVNSAVQQAAPSSGFDFSKQDAAGKQGVLEAIEALF